MTRSRRDDRAAELLRLNDELDELTNSHSTWSLLRSAVGVLWMLGFGVVAITVGASVGLRWMIGPVVAASAVMLAVPPVLGFLHRRSLRREIKRLEEEEPRSLPSMGP